jgi:hypothetical protein
MNISLRIGFTYILLKVKKTEKVPYFGKKSKNKSQPVQSYLAL